MSRASGRSRNPSSGRSQQSFRRDRRRRIRTARNLGALESHCRPRAPAGIRGALVGALSLRNAYSRDVSGCFVGDLPDAVDPEQIVEIDKLV